MSDLLSKRLNLASKAVTAATQLVDSLQILKELKSEYTAIASPFQDSDFAPSQIGIFPNNDLRHLDAYTIGALLSNVVPAIDAVVTDAANGNFNQNILFKVRK